MVSVHSFFCLYLDEMKARKFDNREKKGVLMMMADGMMNDGDGGIGSSGESSESRGEDIIIENWTPCWLTVVLLSGQFH